MLAAMPAAISGNIAPSGPASRGGGTGSPATMASASPEAMAMAMSGPAPDHDHPVTESNADEPGPAA
jgi:hypothetical protein